jgi:hypothetical protein
VTLACTVNFTTGDDNVAVHANGTLVEDSYFGSGHGASIGSLCDDWITNVTFRNISFHGWFLFSLFLFLFQLEICFFPLFYFECLKPFVCVNSWTIRLTSFHAERASYNNRHGVAHPPSVVYPFLLASTTQQEIKHYRCTTRTHGMPVCLTQQQQKQKQQQQQQTNKQTTVGLIPGTTTGCRIKSHPGCSGHVWDIVYTDLTMHDVGQPIFLDEFYSAPPVRLSQ